MFIGLLVQVGLKQFSYIDIVFRISIQSINLIYITLIKLYCPIKNKYVYQEHGYLLPTISWRRYCRTDMFLTES